MVGARNAAWLLALLLASALLLALSALPQAGRLEAALSGIVAPVASSLRASVDPVADVLLHAGQIHVLSTENADLRRELARSEADLAALREERTRINLAAGLIAAVGDRADEFLPAAVLARDPAPGRQVLLIDRGRRDGVRLGQPVLGPGATLVGIVTHVDERQTRVRLLNDRDSAVATMVQSSRTPGSLLGTDEGLRLDLVPLGSGIAEGDVVLSSALGGLLPPGLLAGKVTSVTSQPQDLFETIEVEPLSDLTRVEQVLVMTGFTPGSGFSTADATAEAPASGSTP
ncbi:MAG: rod shape-determining protein MreC [Dehalococcoidia bacterium]